METIKIKINNKHNLAFLIELLSKFNFVEEIIQIEINQEAKFLYQSSNKNSEEMPSIEDFEGMWKDNPKTLEQIREKAWKRNI